MTSGPLARSEAFTETLAPNYNPFDPSLAPAPGVTHCAFGAAGPSGETLQFREQLHALGKPRSSVHVLQAAQDAPKYGVPPPATQMGLGMLESDYNVGNILGTGDAPINFFGANSAGVNPFLCVSPQTGSENITGSEPNELIIIDTNTFLL